MRVPTKLSLPVQHTTLIYLLVYDMTFTEYLTSKKIDATRFAAEAPAVYAEWARLFDQMSPASFTVNKKFLLNPTRRKYLLR